MNVCLYTQTLSSDLQLWRNLQIPKTDSASQRQRWIPHDPRRQQGRSGAAETSKSNRLERSEPTYGRNSHVLLSSEEMWLEGFGFAGFQAQVLQLQACFRDATGCWEILLTRWCQEGRTDEEGSVMKWWIFSLLVFSQSSFLLVNPHHPLLVKKSIAARLSSISKYWNCTNYCCHLITRVPFIYIYNTHL